MAKTATKSQTKPAPKPAGKPAGKPAASTAQRPAPAPSANRKDPEPERKPVGARATPASEGNHPAPAVQRPRPPVAAGAANLPAHMQHDVDMGKENIGQADMDIPRLKLIQGLSKELQVYDDLRVGHFFHTATETIFDEPFRVVPVFFDKQYILWRPLEDGGGILARTTDGVHWEPPHGEFTVKLDRKDGGHQVTWKLAPTVRESGLANWGTMNPGDNNSPPAATLMYNFLLAFPDNPEILPAVLTFQRSSIKVGRKFMTKLKTVRTPLFGSIFTLSAAVDHNSANQEFQNISIVGSGLVEDPEMYDEYKSLYLSLAKSGLNIKDIDSLQGDPEAAGKDDPDAPNY